MHFYDHNFKSFNQFCKKTTLFVEIPVHRRMLKRTAVPSCNLPSSNTAKYDCALRRKKRCDARNSKKAETVQARTKEPDSPVSKEAPNYEEVQIEVGVNSIEENSDLYADNFKDIGIEVKTFDLVTNFTDLLKSDENLSAATGIESFSILNCIIQLCSCLYPQENDDSIRMSLRNKIIMTYMKLKHNLSYVFLALLFNCYSARHCSRVFEQMIIVLSTALQSAIRWPSKEEIRRNIPICFQDFTNVRVVLDCTEIFIQNPKNLRCQIVTYSHYKGGKTIKFMTGETPAGNISFISKAYGGRVSDKAIFEQSNPIHSLEPGDGIMVDRGFLIDEICSSYNVQCIRPPFMKNKTQLSKSESRLTQGIARARVHIERSNQRIKTFDVLGGIMPRNLVPFATEIFTIICATVNLSSPILADDKFFSNK